MEITQPTLSRQLSQLEKEAKCIADSSKADQPAE